MTEYCGINIEASRLRCINIDAMQQLYRQESDWWIVRDSLWQPGLADHNLVLVDGRIAGYTAVANTYMIGASSSFMC
jgi:hypothetical protein